MLLLVLASTPSSIFQLALVKSLRTANHTMTTTTATVARQLDGNTAVATFPSRDLGCDVCFEILDVFNTPLSEANRVVIGKVGDNLAYDCPHSDWIRNLLYNDGRGPHYEDCDLVLHRDRCRTGASFMVKHWEPGKWEALHWSEKFTLVSRQKVPRHPGTSRILDKCWTDLDLVKDWYGRCMGGRGNECERSAIPGLTPFSPQWLVDVNEACIVPCEGQGTRFLTLSYTWSQTRSFRTTRSTFEEV